MTDSKTVVEDLAAVCVCGKPLSHVDADPESSDWACRIRGAAAAELAAEVEPWLQECGSCDAGLPMACTCPKGDYRVVLLKVWRAYEAAVRVSHG